MLTLWALVFYGLVVWFLGHFLAKNLSIELLSRILSPIAIITLGCWVLCRHLMAATWRILLEDAAQRHLSKTDIGQAYAKSAFGRYIPGKVFLLAARITACHRLGVTLPAVLGTSLAEALLGAVAAAAIGLTLVLVSGSFGTTLQVLAVLFPLILCAFVSLGITRPLQFAQTISRLGPHRNRLLGWTRHVTARAVSSGIYLALGAQILSALGFLAWASTGNIPLTWSNGSVIAGSFPLAGIAGMIALTPAGIGFRETAQLPIIMGLVDTDDLVLLVIGARFLDVFADVGYFGISWLAPRIARIWRLSR